MQKVGNMGYWMVLAVHPVHPRSVVNGAKIASSRSAHTRWCHFLSWTVIKTSVNVNYKQLLSNSKRKLNPNRNTNPYPKHRFTVKSGTPKTSR